jgi:hypothetical protein
MEPLDLDALHLAGSELDLLSRPFHTPVPGFS